MDATSLSSSPTASTSHPQAMARGVPSVVVLMISPPTSIMAEPPASMATMLFTSGQSDFITWHITSVLHPLEYPYFLLVDMSITIIVNFLPSALAPYAVRE